MTESNPDAALAALPQAVTAELEWLAGQGAPLAQQDEPVEIWEVERIDLGSDVSRGRWVGAFRYERRPTTDGDVELALARTAHVRAGTRSLLDREGASSPDTGTELAQRAQEVVALLTRLGTRPEADLPPAPREMWEAAWHLAEERLRALLPGDRERHAVFDGEEWTTRKVLRVLAVGERALYARLVSRFGATAPFSFGGSATRRQAPR